MYNKYIKIQNLDKTFSISNSLLVLIQIGNAGQCSISADLSQRVYYPWIRAIPSLLHPTQTLAHIIQEPLQPPGLKGWVQCPQENVFHLPTWNSWILCYYEAPPPPAKPSFSMDEFHTIIPLGILPRSVESQKQKFSIASIVLTCLYFSSITFFFLYYVSLFVAWLESWVICIFMFSLHL